MTGKFRSAALAGRIAALLGATALAAGCSTINDHRGFIAEESLIGAIQPGDRCGFGTLGQYSANIAVGRDASGRPTLSMEVGEDRESGPQVEVRVDAHPIVGDSLWLRADLDFRSDEGRLAYSLDGARWTNLGGPFPLAFAWRTGTFQGEQFALFCYARGPSRGHLDVDSFSLRPLPD